MIKFEEFLQWCHWHQDEIVGTSNNFVGCPVYNFLKWKGINCLGVGDSYYEENKSNKFNDVRFHAIIDLIDSSNERLPITGREVFNLGKKLYETI